MATIRQILDAARALDRANDLVGSLQARKQTLQNQLAEVNAELDIAVPDRTAKVDALKALVSEE